ncbi:MAG TPA: hypothetical protein DEA55_06320 [Rhodospirillaceae bacterium]|nr:hypothetical protein [Rhodospirillaceae bacterium]
MNKRDLKNIAWLGVKKLVGRTNYEKIRTRYNIGYWPDLKNPRTYCEQMICMKLAPKPYFSKLADKYAVRDFVEKRIGKNFLTRLYMVCDRVEDIPWDKLPNSFVLKAVHSGGSQGVIIVRDLAKENRTKLIARAQRAYKTRFGSFTNEDHYLSIKPRLIAEELLIDETTGLVPVDYKCYCFGGTVKVIECHTDRFGNHLEAFYTPEWKRLDMTTNLPPSGDLPRPKHLREFVEAAEKLAAGFKFVRVDFYDLPDRIVFGEMTFTGASGWLHFTPHEVDHEWGEWLRNTKEDSYSG